MKAAAHAMKDMPNISTVGGFANAMDKMGSLILKMRKDLRLCNRGIVDNVPAEVTQSTVLASKQMFRYPELFLRCVRENASMSMKEIASREAELDW